MRKRQLQSGQTMVMLLIFMIIAMTITAAAIAMMVINTRANSKFALGTVAYYAAESGAENAILRLLRNPSYTGETMTVGDGTAVISVNGADPKVITSVGTVDNFKRTIQVVAGYTNNILTVTSWREI